MSRRWSEQERLKQKRRRYLANPDNAQVDTDEVIEHINYVLSHFSGNNHIGPATLAKAAEEPVGGQTLSAIYHGRRKYIANKTARAIFSIVPENVPARQSHRTDATLTRARLRRLRTYEGVTYDWLANQTNISRAVINAVINERTNNVNINTEEKVRKFTEQFIEQKVNQSLQAE